MSDPWSLRAGLREGLDTLSELSGCFKDEGNGAKAIKESFWFRALEMFKGTR